MHRHAPRAAFILSLTVFVAGCVSLGASADAVQPFPLNPSYTERLADPGKVDLACYDNGHKDDGQLKAWDDSYCGCVVEMTKTVWIARSIRCDLERVRKHENCHIETGPSAAARADCDRRF